MVNEPEWQARAEPGYVGLSVEPDICGTLPSGEHCSLDPDHDGKHMALEMRLVPTRRQET